MMRIERTACAALMGLAGAVPVWAGEPAGLPCATGDTPLNVGFYAYFAPVSYSADTDPHSPGFDNHRGYEADLLSALEAMQDADLSFSRRGIAEWSDIWLRSASPDHDLIGGGITILESRTRDAAGREAVRFTSGHILFRQSLLVRSEDVERLASHDDLTDRIRVGVLPDTTGEARLLQITGLADASGVLAAGTQVETPAGPVTADGSAAYMIHAGGTTANVAERRRLVPPSPAMPQVIYLGEVEGEAELLAALRDGAIDALARGEIGNRDAARTSGGMFAVTALDPEVEKGGFTVAADDAALAMCLDDKIAWLTEAGAIGFGEWIEDPSVFMQRAHSWRPRERAALTSSLSGSAAALASGAARAIAATGGARGSMALWGQADTHLFEAGHGGGEGRASAAYLGIEGTVGTSLRAGVALVRGRMDADYDLGRPYWDGELRGDLSALLPYLRLATGDGTEAWAMLGAGQGTITHSRTGGRRAGGAGLDMRMAALGARRELARAGGIDWTLLGDASLVHIETDAGPGNVHDISADLWQAGAGVEGTLAIVLADGAVVTPSLAIFARADHGDADEGVGLELGPAVAYSSLGGSLRVEAAGYVLAAHSVAGRRAYGVRATAAYTPRADEGTLSLALSPWSAGGEQGLVALGRVRF